MATPPDYDRIVHIQVSYTKNFHLPHLHDNMNDLYAGTLYKDEIDDMFVIDDDGKRTAKKDGGQGFINNLHQAIIEHMYKPIVDKHFPDDSIQERDWWDPAEHFLDRAAIKINIGEKQKSRLTEKSFDDMVRRLTANKNTLFLEINMSHVHIVDYQPGQAVDMVDWRLVRFEGTRTAQQTQNPTTAGMAPFDSNAFANTLSTTLANALTPVVESVTTATTNISQQVAQGVRSGAQSYNNTSAYTFNVNNLPTAVRTIYERRKEGKVLCKNMLAKDFPGGKRYHEDGERLFLVDGTLFLPRREPNEKGLFKTPISCKDDSYTGIRMWYDGFTKHCMDKGYYVHPLYLFRKEHGGNWGFTFGDDPDDDLPKSCELKINSMSLPIWKLLQSSSIVPSDSEFSTIVTQCQNDGYMALKQMMTTIHPEFHLYPNTMITAYPKQRDRSLLKYHAIFTDYLQLRAYILNQDSSMGDKAEIDVFISNSKYSHFLHAVTRQERADTTLAHKYTACQIVETLTQHLRSPDSPLYDNIRRTPSPKSTESSSGSSQSSLRSQSRSPDLQRSSPRKFRDRPPRSPRVRRVNPVKVDVQEQDHESDDDGELAVLALELSKMDIPDDDDARICQAGLTYMVNRVQADPTATNKPMTCIVCGGTHTFDDCEVLNNHEFLKSHYIRFTQAVRRDINAREAARSNPREQTASVNFLDGTTQDNDSDSEDEEHFLTGRH